MTRIELDLPEESVRGTPQELARGLRLAAAIFWYARGKLSQERAAQVAGLDRTEFLLALSRERVELFQADAETLGTRP